MFRIESYITPVILNHVAKYVKNIRPQDAQVSLWEGEASFQNLDLRLDVLEEELNLPFEFLSGHIHELSIAVPWTRITSEPIRITINTIEFVLKLKDLRAQASGSSANSSPQRADSQKRKRESKQEEPQPAPSAAGGLVNKIITNITVNCHNIILKYVEEDIVVSMNVQLLSYGPADENWNYNMVDLHPMRVLSRTLLQISDLTICLDKRNAAGQIDVCQEPVLYRCSLECRILRKHNIKTKAVTSLTRVGVFTKSLDINVSSLQFPMAMRIVHLIMALKSGDIKNPPANESTEEEEAEHERTEEGGVSYLSWAWNLLPSLVAETPEEEDHTAPDPTGHVMDMGIYIEQLNFTIKNSEFVNDSIMGAAKRIRYNPIVRISIGGMFFERVSCPQQNWSSIKMGISRFSAEPLGAYCISESDCVKALVEADSYDDLKSFIDKSLFDEKCLTADRGWAVTNYDDYAARITDEYLLFRSPIFAFDLVDFKTDSRSNPGALDLHVQYRFLSSGIKMRYNQTFLQVKNLINGFIESYDYPAYYIERTDSAMGRGSSLKLQPPLMEDYDALMQHIPLVTYKLDFKNIKIELHAKTVEEECTQKSQKSLSLGVMRNLPHFLLHLEHVECARSTPIDTAKLVHLTCQLPDKPMELLNACYNNYDLKVKNLTMSLVNPNFNCTALITHLPHLVLSYSSLLQPLLWNDESVPTTKFDFNCKKVSLDFSKRDLISSQRLLSCIISCQLHQARKLAKHAALPYAKEDNILLQNQLKDVCIVKRGYQSYGIWNASLMELQSDLVRFAANEELKCRVLSTTPKLHNNRHKWLEWQAQFPNAENGDLKTAMGLWVEQFNVTLDRNILEFLKYHEEPERYFERQISADAIEAPVTQPQTPPVVVAATPTFNNPLSTRRSSRQSLTTRKVSHPEETVHFSSERDDKIEKGTTASASIISKDAAQIAQLNYFKFLIISIEVQQGVVDITEDSVTKSNFTRIQTPLVSFKSTHSEYISRASMRLKIAFPTQPTDTFKWTIGLTDFTMHECHAGMAEDVVLKAVQTTITVALTHKTEKLVVGNRASSETITQHLEGLQKKKSSYTKMPVHQKSSLKVGSLDFKRSSAKSGKSSDAEYSDSSLEVEPETNDDALFSETLYSPKKSEKEPKSLQVKDIITLSLHVDTTPVHFVISTKKAKTLQQRMSLLFEILQRIPTVAQASAISSVHVPPKVITAAEENPVIKEFLEFETNSEESFGVDLRDTLKLTISLLCQWTITKIIVELENDINALSKKIVLELEDLLSTVDKRDDFTKYTAKIGQFNLKYLELNDKEEWLSNEALRIQMFGEISNLPFLNIVLTIVGIRNFYRKIGAKRRGDLSRNLSEVVITMQALEAILSLDKINEFLPFICVFASEPKRNDEQERAVRSSKQQTTSAVDLPLLHLDSKGITIYLPHVTKSETCSVAIFKIESIKITPNLENPLQRNPIRTDVFSKAAQMGILGIPGSLVEDRQYELTIRNISAATANWPKIITHMRNKSNSFLRTNPAFEWNNQERKTLDLQTSDIFTDFTFMAIYAPNIVYNNVLICGQSMEFNCAADFTATLTTQQLMLLSCLIVGYQNISSLASRTCSPRLNKTSSSRSMLTGSSLKLDGFKTRSFNSNQRGMYLEQRHTFHDTRGSSAIFESIEEDAEQQMKTDSGFQSLLSRTQSDVRAVGKDRRISSGSSILKEHTPVPVVVRQLPYTLSLVTGEFSIRLYDEPCESEQRIPLIAVIVSEPSFMITQNIYDVVTQVSVFDVGIYLPTAQKATNGEEDVFTEPVLHTRPGKVNVNGIPPALLNLKLHRTKMQLLELELEVSRQIVLTLSEKYITLLWKNMLLIYSTLLEEPCFDVRPMRQLQRASKIKLMRRQCFDADRITLRFDRILVKFTDNKVYLCELACQDLKANVKFLNRPEKVYMKASIGSVYLRTGEQILVQPIALRLAADFVSEPWHTLPLITSTVKCNVVQIDLGILAMQHQREAMKGLERVTNYMGKEWRQFLRKRPTFGDGHLDRETLIAIKCPSLVDVKKVGPTHDKRRQHREEFYQDDLRAGAFQFVELITDTFLPLPYQIQIIKKNYGIICWRYPQPRKMSKIHIYPVPMAVPNPIHIRCRMEYFSEPHESFQHYCDFWLSETVTKHIALPEHDICANIWRVVILQSLVTVDGECFDTSEEDEELRSISSVKFSDVLDEDSLESDFFLDPKVLVGCMRIDTSFQSSCVPKAHLLFTCNQLQVNFLNQCSENEALPAVLQNLRQAHIPQGSHAFLVLSLDHLSCHSAFFTRDNYSVNASLTCNLKCIDYGYLNMLHILNDMQLQIYTRVNKSQHSLITNLVADKLHLNIGPAAIHSLLTSKRHWDEQLNAVDSVQVNALLPKCIIVNSMHSCVSFGQTGTTERIILQPQECHFYTFRSDYHAQELTFFIADDEASITEASQSVFIPLKLSSKLLTQPIRVGNKCVILQMRKLSATQIYVLIKGQIELISMVPLDLRVEFHREGKQCDEKRLLDYSIGKNGRASFYRLVQQASNIFMRELIYLLNTLHSLGAMSAVLDQHNEFLWETTAPPHGSELTGTEAGKLKLTNPKGKGRSGDIPLKTNKNLPWLVKVPAANNSFISLWVRILREDINEIGSDTFCPQRILITIWPIFEIQSNLSCPVFLEESSTLQELQLDGGGDRLALNVPATHLTDHKISFVYNLHEHEFTLSLKSIDWNKFFWYDEQKWTIDYALDKLEEVSNIKWPKNEEEELRVCRLLKSDGKVTINIKCQATREFSCALCLDIAPWGIFINASGLGVGITYAEIKGRTIVPSNAVDMMYFTRSSFAININSGQDWISSAPIYFANTMNSGTTAGLIGSYYVLDDNAAIEIMILRGREVIKFVLEHSNENGCQILRLQPKYAIGNFTTHNLSILAFAMDYKETAQREDVTALQSGVQNFELNPAKSIENCIGLTLDYFYDLHPGRTRLPNDTPFICFICVQIEGDEGLSIPIPLALPFTRRCFSIQNGRESIALVAALIERNKIYYLSIFADTSPAILLNNETDVKFVVAQTSASENSKVTNVTPEYDGRHFVWFQYLPAYSKCFYTPTELYANFPDVESVMCNITLALYTEDSIKTNFKWSKPLRTDKSGEKFLQIPNHGDVKVVICEKHRVVRISIYYIAQQLEFSVKDLRSRLLTPQTAAEPDTSNLSLRSLENVPTTEALTPLPTSMRCIHFSSDCAPQRTLKSRFFIKELVISFYTDSKERDCVKKEVCAMYIDDMVFAYDKTEEIRKLDVLMSNLQIDNHLHASGKYDFPVVLCAQEVYKHQAILPQIHEVDRFYIALKERKPMAVITMEFFDDEMKLKSLTCNFSSLRAYIEDAYLTELFDALLECEPSNCVFKAERKTERVRLADGQILFPRDIVAQATCIAEPLQLRSFCIEPLNILLSVHTTVRLYIALDHSPLSFSRYERHRIITLPLRFGQSLGMHYLSGAIFGAGWVVGSLEILGSPSGLARSFSTGLRDFVSMPVQGLFRGPWGFIVGVTQGSASLLRNVTAGTVNSVTKLASSVARNLDRLTLDQEHIDRTDALRRTRPQGFTQGFSKGVTGLGISILGAVGGIARHTLEAQSPFEVVTGMGKGIVGVFTKPISGAAELVALTGQGMLHTVGFNAMPQQRPLLTCQSVAVEPSAQRIWKLLPNAVTCVDQLLCYYQITFTVRGKPQRGYVLLTTTIFAVIEAQWDKLALLYPVNKLELTRDSELKTVFYVRMTKEKEDVEEDWSYTNQRIMNFLHSSHALKSTPSSLQPSDFQEVSNQSTSAQSKLGWSFYINEDQGEHLLTYLRVLNQ